MPATAQPVGAACYRFSSFLDYLEERSMSLGDARSAGCQHLRVAARSGTVPVELARAWAAALGATMDEVWPEGLGAVSPRLSLVPPMPARPPAAPSEPKAKQGRAPRYPLSVDRPVPLPVVLDAVARTFGVSVDDLLEPSRQRRFTQARNVAYWLARELTGLSYPALGRAFGRHHTSVLSGYRRVAHDPVAQARARRAKALIEGHAEVAAEASLPQLCAVPASHPELVALPVVLDAVARTFGVSVDDLLGPSRQRRFTQARNIAYWLARELTGLSFTALGTELCRDPTSVLSGYRRVAQDPAAQVQARRARALIEGQAEVAAAATTAARPSQLFAMPTSPTRPALLSAVVRAVARTFGVSVDDLLGCSRQHRCTQARNVAYWLARELTGLSFPDLGQVFGRHHTSVLSGYRRVAQDPTAQAWALRAKALIEGGEEGCEPLTIWLPTHLHRQLMVVTTKRHQHLSRVVEQALASFLRDRAHPHI